MNEQQRKRKFGESSLFIFKFMRKYWLGLIFVVIFILFTTYLQVIAPKLLGNSIDELATYVGVAKTEQLQTDIRDGKGITEENKKSLSDSGVLTEEQIKKMNESTPEELKNALELQDYYKKIFYDYNVDKNESVIKGQGLSEDQLQIINDYDIDDNIKQQTLMINQMMPIQLQKTFIKNQGGYTDEELKLIDDSKSSLELETLFNNVGYRNYVIKLDEKAIKNENGLTEKQINYLNENTKANQFGATTEFIDSIKKLSNEQLKDINSSIKEETKTKTEQYVIFLNAIKLLVLSYLALAIAMFLYNVLMGRVTGKTTGDMRNELFGKLEQLSIRFFDSSNDGDLLSRFTNDIDNISTALNQSLVQSLSQIAMLFGIVYMMFIDDETFYTLKIFGNDFVINDILVWIMLIFAVFAILIAMIIIKKAKYYISRQQGKLGALNGYIDERISGQKVIISYGLEEETIKHFEEYNEQLKSTSIKGQLYSGILMPLMQGIGLVNLGVLVFLGGMFVSKGFMTIGLLTTFIQYSQRFFNPLAQIVAQYNMLELAATGAIRVKEVFEVEPEIIDLPGAKPITGIDGKVSLENVNFGYYEDKLVLKDINLEVNKGQMIALVGPTGSGKTTVMNLMNRFYDINSGEIKFDGTSIKDITVETLRKNVGIVLQESLLFSGTVKENIAYGKDDATDDEIIQAAKTANIHEFIMTLEDQYETRVDNNSSLFSTGQKQLMSIARTILTNPDLLILDEATSNVDTVTEAKIQKAMENVLKGRTSFVIAHRLKTILNADEIIVLKDGEIIEQGNHEKLLKEKGFYAELYYNQFVVE